jgi:hypothetical protein
MLTSCDKSYEFRVSHGGVSCVIDIVVDGVTHNRLLFGFNLRRRTSLISHSRCTHKELVVKLYGVRRRRYLEIGHCAAPQI